MDWRIAGFVSGRKRGAYKDPYRKTVTKKGCGKEVNEILSYAYEISGNDKRFVKMLVAENGTVDPRRQSDQYQNRIRESSFGICQIHCKSHSEVCGSSTKPTWEGFYDWKWQVNKCYEMYVGGTTFYGLRNIGVTDGLLTFHK